ncbi:MAG: hypothetical protein UZ19_OD1000136 [Parcubacteria bacterium OLB19]|nr:MAG: hypothetical protein UZ19_OD1000136 [Parcubacteria bacterium OLB19]
MFVIPTQVGFTHRVVAMLVACATILWSLGVYSTAQAANLTDISDTLTDSGPSVVSGHDIAFTIPTGSTLLNAGTTTITFPVEFTGVNTVVSGDLSVTVNGTPDAIGGFLASGQTISFSGVAATATEEVRVVIADGKITNPGTASTSYEIIVATPSDTGKTRVAIVDYVEVSAIVETTFDFVVAGLATSTAINGTSTTGATTPTTIPFGILEADSIYTLGQQLSVSTNARNGFVVTVEQDGNLRSSTLADIDGFIDGAYTNTPVAWATPTESLLQENTWGHWGLTSNDSDLNAGEFTGGGGNKWVAASTTPRQIFSHTGSADGTTQDYGQIEVAYQVQITPLQEAADDYNTTLMYIATPTF